jgi:hypothetical protein
LEEEANGDKASYGTRLVLVGKDLATGLYLD